LHRYKIDIAIPAKTSVDPRIAALYNKAADLVGISGASEELIMRLTEDDDKSAQQRIISVVGFGGLGKTTLAKAVYDKLKGQFDCTAFVPVGRHRDLNKVLKAISVDLGMHLNLETLDERQLIDKLREFLENKRWVSSATHTKKKILFHIDEISAYLALLCWAKF
jgi:disease resistance protein RPM1